MKYYFECIGFEMPLNHLSHVVCEAVGHRGLQRGLAGVSLLVIIEAWEKGDLTQGNCIKCEITTRTRGTSAYIRDMQKRKPKKIG